jgi:NADPH:quinone reductase
MATTTVTTRAARRRTSTVPTTMKAAAIDRFGPPAVLTLHTLPVPQPGPSEILIALYSAGVGVWDDSVRDGSWQPYGRTKFPLIPGTDGAGIVVAKGARVRNVRLGERVWACDYANPKGGFYAEYVAVNVQHAGRVAKHLDLLQAGAAPTTGLTALQGIDEKLQVRRGELVLIFGASGGVGTLAVQFARRKKANVIGTASGRAAATLVRKLGAEEVFDARGENAFERLRALAPNGIDAVLALAGGDALERCLDLVNPNGRVAYPNGVEPEPRRRSRLRIVSYDAMNGPREFANLGRAASEARLQVPIAAVFPLAQAAKAHERIERGHIVGRIALRIRRGDR